MFERYNAVHFIGIGGIGMSGIAEVLHNLDFEVTGSDEKDSETVQRLKNLGIRVSIGHSSANVRHADVAVVSSAVARDNPEVMEAVRLAIPVIPRAEMLAEIGRLKYSILVAGSHGKTTTTSFISTVLAHAGFDPTVVIGGRLKAIGTNARLGRGEFFVAEADESDGSFLKLNPTIGIVTNIDREHMDYFKDMETLKRAFVDFINKVPFYGSSILCIDDQNIRGILGSVHRRHITYGFSDDAELRAADVQTGFMSSGFKVLFRGEDMGVFELPVPGRHMVLNSLACIAVGIELQIGLDSIREALKGFKGIQRRLELKGEEGGVKVYDDYGHHPTEINATLGAVKESVTANKLIVIFQPHRFSRTRDLFDAFTGCFYSADVLIVLDIYAAGETPLEGINSDTLVSAMKRLDVYRASSTEDAAKIAVGMCSAGDIVVTLGAGDVWKAADAVLRNMKDRGK